ncbi:MAG: DUF3795 domain-containing protein [Bacteroidota bacterium]|nr:DUF3795 domain-containing protein [Bacteroidota bacterium]
METTMAYCGLICESCPIHLATLEQDKSLQETMRISIAEQCFTFYGMNMRPEDITDCDGCKAPSGKLFSGCLSCGIRSCARQRNIENCAYCNDYFCERLSDHFLLDPEAQTRLEEIRQTIRS